MPPQITPTSGPFEVSERLCAWLLDSGRQPLGKGIGIDGIPGVNSAPTLRSVSLLNIKTGEAYTNFLDDGNERFSQQSMSKAFAACFLMSATPGMTLDTFKRAVGNDFSGLAYNGVNFRDPVNDRVPFNYSDNIGALAVWGHIYKRLKTNAFTQYLQFMKDLTMNQQLDFKLDMARGEYEHQPADGTDATNWQLLRELGYDKHNPKTSWEAQQIYRFYTQACAIMVTTLEVAYAFGMIANGGVHPKTKRPHVPHHVARHVFDGLARHGAYDESQIWHRQVALHSKTGVDGGIVGTLELHRDMVVSGRHPLLNRKGNSIEAYKWIKHLAGWQLIWPNGRPRYELLPDPAVTGEATHKLLKEKMLPQRLRQLESLIDKQPKQDSRTSGYHMKPYGNKNRIAEGATLLGSFVDRDSVLQNYYYLEEGKYNSVKIMVQPG